MIDEIRNSQDNNNDEDRYEPSEDDSNKKRGHILIYISCAVFFALFVKSDRFNLACRTDQSLECNRFPEKKADEGIPLLSHHSNKNKQLDKCKWCKQHMKPTEPMPIMNFKQESLEDLYESNSKFLYAFLLSPNMIELEKKKEKRMNEWNGHDYRSVYLQIATNKRLCSL